MSEKAPIMPFQITEAVVRKLVATVDAGLSHGVGEPVPGKMCVEAAISYALGEPHSDGPSCVNPVVRAAKIRLNDGPWSGPIARARGMRAVAIAQLGSKGTIDSNKFVELLAEYTIREVVPLALRATAQLNPKHALQLEAAAVRCHQDGDKDAAYAATSAADAAAYAEARVVYAADAARAAAYAAAAVDAAYAADAAAYAAAYAEAYAEDAAAAAGDAAAYAVNAAHTYAADEKDRILALCASLMVRALKECGSPGCDWLWLLDEIPVPA